MIGNISEKRAGTNNLRTIGISFLILFMLIIFVNAGPSLESVNGHFYEDFETGSLATNNWETSGVGKPWVIDPGAEQAPIPGSSFQIYTENTDGLSLIQNNISTINYQNINFSFWAETTGLDTGEFFIAEWYNGTGWTELLNVEDIVGWTQYSYLLGSSADNNADFIIRFQCSSGGNNEECLVDQVNVSGVTAIDPLINITYPLNQTYNLNVSNLNYTLVIGTSDTCWYTTDEGTTNTTITCGTNVTDITSDEGSNTWTAYVNDTSGSENTSSITFFKDTIYPTIDYGVNTYADNSNLSVNNIYVNTTWTEINFANISFYLYNNSILINTTTYTTPTYDHNWTSLTDGNYTYHVNITDVVNNMNSTVIRSVKLDVTAPSANLNTPINNTFSNVTSQNLTVNLSDTTTGIKNATLWIFNESGLFNNTEITDFATDTFTSALGVVVTFVDGVYDWFYSLFDIAGNEGTSENYTLTIDTLQASIELIAPTNNEVKTEKNISFTFNATDSRDTSLNCSIYIEGILNKTNSTVISGVNTIIEITGFNHSSYNWNITCNDDSQNRNWSATRTLIINQSTFLANITLDPTPIKGGSQINITAIGEGDADNGTVQFFCSDNAIPTASNTNCTGGNILDTTPPYVLNCNFAAVVDDDNHTMFCRTYDGEYYSQTYNVTYESDSTPPSTTLISVAGDTSATYFDNVDDGVSEVNISGEAGMSCRWSSGDLTYSSMTNDCSVDGLISNCSINDVASQGLVNRYVSCQDSLTNEQDSSQNLDVQFFLDYSAPTTIDNSSSTLVAPDYIINISEIDNVDTDPTTVYCTGTIGNCVPGTSIDNGGTITFTSANRGKNYLRYYSTDDAGNTQATQNKTININQISTFLSAVDNAATIKAGTTVNVSANITDADVGQEMTIFVCDSSLASSAGCGGTQYCNATSTGNTSCSFSSELDDATHTWYAFLYDDLNEGAVNNFSGSYTTDNTGPVITTNSPLNQTYTQDSVSASITLNEAGSWVGYSLDNAANVTMSNTSATEWSTTLSGLSDGSHNITFYANDSYGNMENTSIVFFSVDTAGTDTTPPTITIWSPTNGIYYTDANRLFNITTDENASWAGYSINQGSWVDLDNHTVLNWNSTVTLTEGQKNITFYANDTSNNQGNKTIIIYIDLTNPSVDAFSCTSPVNNTQDVSCNANLSDAVGLDYAIIGHNATGTWINSSQIAISGSSDSLNYIISVGNHTPPRFSAEVYGFDLSGRSNTTTSIIVNVTDGSFPEIYNITYQPNTSAELDPGVLVRVNATVIEDYQIGDVFFMYKNSSSSTWTLINMTNLTARTANTPIVYNASFTPQNENWTFVINATDSSGNQNISQNTTINVENELTQNITTDVTAVKAFTTAQEGNNKSLGNLFMNNTADSELNFSVSLNSASLGTRLSINYTGDQSVNYSAAAGVNITLPLDINTTSLSDGTYDYTINISSSAGEIGFSRQVTIQLVAEPILTTTIIGYSSTVTRGQTGVELIAQVENDGLAAATDTYLNWSLPSEFTLTSGSLSRSLGTLGVGLSGTNTITISVANDASSSSVNINATSTASNADSTSATKNITISDPVVITTPVEVSGGGGGGGGAPTSVSYSQTAEVVRGEEGSFKIEVYNRFKNSTLENLILELSGLEDGTITISPEIIGKIEYNETKSFIVTIDIPSYKGFEEIDLIAKIKGIRITPIRTEDYRETRNIKFLIQEIDIQEANLSLIDAEKAIALMEKEGFNVEEVSRMLRIAKIRLENNRNKEAFDLAREIVKIKDIALETDNLITNLFIVIENPRRISLITGNVAREIVNDEQKVVSARAVLTGNAILSSKSVKEMTELAKVAFDRGDFILAKERAQTAQFLLLLERKGNLALFLYLYWPIILLFTVIFSFLGIIGYRKYQQVNLTEKINEINDKESNIQKLMVEAQRSYLLKKTGETDYKLSEDEYQKESAKLKQLRTELRNKRIRLIKSQQVLKDLDIEKGEIEDDIRDLQERFYKRKDRKRVSEKEYKLQFGAFNKRLAEIEDERTTINLEKLKKEEFEKENRFVLSKKDIMHIRIGKMWDIIKHKVRHLKERKKNEDVKIAPKEVPKKTISEEIKKSEPQSKKPQPKLGKIKKKKNLRVLTLIKRPIKDLAHKIRSRNARKGVMLIDNGFIEKLKEEVKDLECKGKWIRINHKGKMEANNEKN